MRKFLTSTGLGGLLLLLSFGTQAALISAVNIDSTWAEQADPVTGSEAATWSVSGSSISNGGNATGALISGFTQTGDFSFSSTLTPNGDNDLMGLVFGWQDSDNTYFLGWGGGGVGSTWNGIQLTKFSGGTPVDLASAADIWTSGVSYLFEVGRTGNDIFATITQGVTTIFSTTVTETMFLSGNVGFETWSQNTLFSNTDFSSTSQVPEPGTLALLGLSIAGLGLSRKKKRSI